jgi:WD40 repeat protein/predicted dehydrogenase
MTFSPRSQTLPLPGGMGEAAFAASGTSQYFRLRRFRSLAGPVLLFWIVAAGLLLADESAKAHSGVAAPKPIALLPRLPDWVPCVAFHPNSKLLAAGSYGVVTLFDAVEKRELGTLAEPAGFVKSLAFSPDGRLLVTGSYQVVALWDVESRKLIRQLKGHRGYVTGVAFSADGKRLATTSEDETVKFWNPTTGEPAQTLTGLAQPALGLTFSPDAGLLAVCTGDATRPAKKGTARVFSTAGDLQFTVESHTRVVSAVAFSPDGSTLATASADETIKLWDVATGKERQTLAGHTRPVNTLAYVPGGKWLLSASGGRNVGGNEIKLWDLKTGKAPMSWDGHEGPVHQIGLSADGKFLASGSSDKSVKLWDMVALLAAADAPDKPKEKPQAAPADGAAAAPAAATPAASGKPLRVGIIGLDTSHAIAFAGELNKKDAAADVAGCPVVAAYPKGSPDIESSTSRVPKYTKDIQALGVEIVDSIEALLEKVDVVLLETNDGRPHFEQVLPVLKAGKPVFIDKPIAGSLADAVAIFEAGKKYKVPLFSSSSLRYAPGAQEIRSGKIGEVKGCDAYSPCSLEPTHPELFWYGIHGVETLFTVMGTGCESVSRVSTPGIDVAVGVWKGGRVGTFRGVRPEAGGGKIEYGGTAFGTNGIQQIGTYGGYRPLVVEIVKFFRTREVPVSEAETLEIYAFMEAADESKRQGGAPVKIETVLAKAREAAKKKLSVD